MKGLLRTEHRFLQGNALDVLRTLPDESVQCCVTDPPYPEVQRDYGRLTERQWHDLMHSIVAHVRRLLAPNGSAVFILQTNQERLGRLRSWLWDFMAWAAKTWNQVQDVYWWNPAALPTVHSRRDYGLCRPSVKLCVWLGAPDCYRDQSQVLWTQSEANLATDRSDRALVYHPSGAHLRAGRTSAAADERGGVTPFNLLPVPNTNSATSSGAVGHGAGTAEAVCSWWVRYICPVGGTVLDPFCGAGTTALAAKRLGRNSVNIELHPEYLKLAQARVDGDGVLPVDSPMAEWFSAACEENSDG